MKDPLETREPKSIYKSLVSLLYVMRQIKVMKLRYIILKALHSLDSVKFQNKLLTKKP